MFKSILKLNTMLSTQFLASFDFDGTLVKPKSGPFPKDKDDWKFYPNPSTVVRCFAELAQQNATIIIRSDQTKPFKEIMIDTVIAYIQQEVLSNYKVKCIIHKVISWDKSTHKPDCKIFEQFCSTNSISLSPLSFHVGDAAGRNGDWSRVDLDFAHKANLTFYTPEEYFRDSADVEEKQQISALEEEQKSLEIGEGLVVMCGLPGSGKSTYCKNYLKNHAYVSGDQLKTVPKIKKAIKEWIAQGYKYIVVDSCNVTPDKRKEYIELAASLSLDCYCIWIDATKEKAIQQNDKRKLEGLPGVPSIAIYTANKKFIAPTEDEGFVKVIKV